MSHDTFGEPLQHYELVGSTNEVAIKWAREDAPHGAVVTAESQTHGRGRRGRSWSSPAGKGLYLSLVLRPDLAPAHVPQLTILAALAVARTVEQFSGLQADTKWPNDVLLNGRKIAGVLCEAEWKDGRLGFAVVGIGLNVNFRAEDLPERVLFPATSLLIETREHRLISEVKPVLLAQTEQLYSLFTNGGWDELRAEYSRRCASIGQPVTVVNEASEYSGVARGIDESGLLIVQTTDGVRSVIAGDVKF